MMEQFKEQLQCTAVDITYTSDDAIDLPSDATDVIITLAGGKGGGGGSDAGGSGGSGGNGRSSLLILMVLELYNESWKQG